jgi:hypothetical protein
MYKYVKYLTVNVTTGLVVTQSALYAGGRGFESRSIMVFQDLFGGRPGRRHDGCDVVGNQEYQGGRTYWYHQHRNQSISISSSKSNSDSKTATELVFTHASSLRISMRLEKIRGWKKKKRLEKKKKKKRKEKRKKKAELGQSKKKKSSTTHGDCPNEVLLF